MKNIIQTIKERKFKYICFFWTIISIQFVIGSNLQTKGYSINSMSEFLISLLKIILFSIIFIAIHYCILELLKKCKKEVKIEKEYNIKKNSRLIYFFIIILAWIPALLAFYPGLLNYDGVYQIRDYILKKFDAGNPLLHTIILTYFYRLGTYYFNSNQLGILLFSIFQMTVMAGCFSYAVIVVEKNTQRKWLRNIILIFYALFPVNQLFSIMTTKDVLFAGMTLIFIINCVKILEEKNNKWDYIKNIIFALLMLLFRNNALYAFVAMIPFILIILIKDKKNLKKLLIIFTITIILYQICNSFLINILNANKVTAKSVTTIFSQAIAKICDEKGEELTVEEKAKISYFYGDYKELGKVYLANISDNTQKLLNIENFNQNKNVFFDLVIKLVKKYPRESIDSLLNTIRGYWYISDNSFNQIQHDIHPDHMGYLELPFNKNEAKEQYILEQISFLPELKEFYRYMFCRNNYIQIPILYIIFQPATYFYILVAFLLYSIYKREKTNLIIGTYLFLYFGTCFLGPVAVVRYIYCIIVSMPILLSSIIKNKKEVENEK